VTVGKRLYMEDVGLLPAVGIQGSLRPYSDPVPFDASVTVPATIDRNSNGARIGSQTIFVNVAP
jgi:hypothetical protein